MRAAAESMSEQAYLEGKLKTAGLHTAVQGVHFRFFGCAK